MPKLERTTLGEFLSSMPAEEKQEILVATLYFYQLGVMRNAMAELGDPSDPETHRKFAELPPESMLKRKSTASIPDFLRTHPRRAELYPDLGDGQIIAICEQLGEAYAEQASIDVDHMEPEDRIARINPFDFAVSTTSFAFAANTDMHGAKPLSIYRLSPQSTSMVVRAIASALRPNVRGLIPAETPR